MYTCCSNEIVVGACLLEDQSEVGNVWPLSQLYHFVLTAHHLVNLVDSTLQLWLHRLTCPEGLTSVRMVFFYWIILFSRHLGAVIGNLD